MTTIEYFDLYTKKLGWKVITIREKSKSPIFRNWNDEYRADWHRFYLENNPNTNLGLLLGNVIDVEADDPLANATLSALVGEVTHFKYSSTKSVHHLFVTPDPKLTRLTVGKIEFRGHRHQSLLPPSISPSGIKYEWLSDSILGSPLFPLAKVTEMPKALLTFYNHYSLKSGKTILPRNAPRSERRSYMKNIERRKWENLDI